MAGKIRGTAARRKEEDEWEKEANGSTQSNSESE